MIIFLFLVCLLQLSSAVPLENLHHDHQLFNKPSGLSDSVSLAIPIKRDEDDNTEEVTEINEPATEEVKMQIIPEDDPFLLVPENNEERESTVMVAEVDSVTEEPSQPSQPEDINDDQQEDEKYTLEEESVTPAIEPENEQNKEMVKLDETSETENLQETTDQTMELDPSSSKSKEPMEMETEISPDNDEENTNEQTIKGSGIIEQEMDEMNLNKKEESETVSAIEAESRTKATEQEAIAFMTDFDQKKAKDLNILYLASWAYGSNITDHNKNLLIKTKETFASKVKKSQADLQAWKNIWPSFTNETLKRQFDLYSSLGNAILPAAKFSRLAKLTTEMREIYSTSQICGIDDTSKCDLSLEPEISKILQKSRNSTVLKHVWTAWRNATGKKMRQQFEESVKLSNEAAVLNGFESLVEQWNDDYEDKNFENEVAQLFEGLKPLYRELHAYARRKLRDVYGIAEVSLEGPIPAHLLGNMWSQTWKNVYDILIPYPAKTSFDITEEMVKQGYTPKLMFEKADDFFASLGLERVSESFWNNSIIERPPNRKLVCHASAWDMRDRKDFRIKQCTVVTMEDFSTVHHEMGHIQYYIQYRNLPQVFRAGANLGFHEAVGDLMSLSVSTPKHLRKVGLLESFVEDYESDINFLLSSALQNVAFLPFGYLVDKWRWDVFRGIVTPDNYTCSWWDYRYNLQGIKPPVQRSEQDFDPAAKYHVAAYSEYIEYFVSRILTFQFHRTSCSLALEYDSTDPMKPLHKCDIHGSEAAGKAIGEMLKIGKSQHWRKTLEAFTGSPELKIKPMLEYFQPLMDWLKADNEKHKEYIGWKGENDFCTRTPPKN